jgi:glycosyltransferase involved in cell wall biosynthesis
MNKQRPIVTIIYRCLPQYRVDFFSRLREQLDVDGIDLQLVYGRNRDVPRQDERDIDWGIPVENRALELFKLKLLWQPLPRRIRDSKLIILLQENKILSNYSVLASAPLRRQKVAFWGIGLDVTTSPGTLANRFKRTYSSWVHWWFAYTSSVARTVAEMGFPPERITVVQNAIDTRGLVEETQRVPPEKVEQLRREMGIGSGLVGLFCGALYEEKRIGFLLEACPLIKKRVPGFEMVFVGAGPLSPVVQAAAAKTDWIHYAGAKFNNDRVPYFKMADVCLMPGLVGLVVLDCFATELPLVTTDYQFRTPEIEYVESGKNGIVAGNSMDTFVDDAVRVLNSQSMRMTLKEGCRQAASQYTLETMVSRFAGGIQQAVEIA